MLKKFDWMENFLESNVAKSMMKQAGSSRTKLAKERVIIDTAKVPHCQNGDTVAYNGKDYTIVNAAFKDAKGAGVVLERTAALEDLDPMAADADADASAQADVAAEGVAATEAPVGAPMAAPMAEAASGMGVQEYARRNPGDVYHYEIRDDVEQPSFMSAADATMNDIKGDHMIDRTTVDGHYTQPPISVNQTASAGAGQGPEVPVASNSQVVGYGYGGGEAGIDPTAPVADMAARDQKVGFDVGEDWVDPTGHGTGNPTPAVNEPHEIQDDYAGAKGTEVPGFVQNVAPAAAAAPTANPAMVNAPGARLDGAAPAAPAAAPVQDDKAEPVTEDVEDDKAEDETVEDEKGVEDGDDVSKNADSDELKGNRVAARLAAMFRK